MGKKLIEKWFPVKEISRDAEIEMAYKSAPAYIKHARELGISGNIGRNFFRSKNKESAPMVCSKTLFRGESDNPCIDSYR